MRCRHRVDGGNDDAGGDDDVNGVFSQERLNKSRFVNMVQSEFLEASVKAVMAVWEGRVVALNPAEDIATHVYVYNNIFITRTMDTRHRVRHLRRLRSAPPVRWSQVVADVFVTHVLSSLPHAHALSLFFPPFVPPCIPPFVPPFVPPFFPPLVPPSVHPSSHLLPAAAHSERRRRRRARSTTRRSRRRRTRTCWASSR